MLGFLSRVSRGFSVSVSSVAKARDRKAYEFHGERAYLNFPEDYAL